MLLQDWDGSKLDEVHKFRCLVNCNVPRYHMSIDMSSRIHSARFFRSAVWIVFGVGPIPDYHSHRGAEVSSAAWFKSMTDRWAQMFEDLQRLNTGFFVVLLGHGGSNPLAALMLSAGLGSLKQWI